MTDDLEHRLTDTLDATADGVTDSAPPSFSWQTGEQPTRRGHRRAALAGAGLVAAAVAAAIVVSTLPSGGTHPAPVADPTHAAQAPSAQTLLLAAAHRRLQAGDAPLADGQYRYVRTVSPAPETAGSAPAGSTATPTSVPAPAGSYTLDELWIPKDVSDTWLRRVSYPGDPQGGPDMTFTGKCGDLYAGTQDGPKGDACTRQGSFEDPTPAFVAGLPRDADALYAQLHSWAEGRLNPDKIHDVNFAIFRGVDDLLDGGMVTSDLTSTLYTVLSRIPGIEVVEGAKNAAGVAGTGFRLGTVYGHGTEASASTATIIVDRTDGAYLGYGEKGPDQDYLDAVSTGVSDSIGVAGH